MTKIKLTVNEALKSDVGRSIARLSSGAMDSLGVKTGEVVEVVGDDGKGLAIVWRGSDEEEKIIRIDGILRSNAGAGIDDEVEVRKAETKPAKKIGLAPTQQIQFGQSFIDYVHERLLNKPFIKGNKILVDVMGNALTFVVKSASPAGNVVVTEETRVVLSSKPVQAAKYPTVTYEDIGGLEEEIEAIREMIEVPMKHPEVFKRLGIQPPKGVMLYGPPGTGKTLLAKAVANETESHFIHLAGPEIMSKWYGQSEENLRQVFKDAQDNAPAIIFIDEIDAIAPSREEVSGEVEKRVVSQLLTSMDGLVARGDVVVIAATNRPDAIDPALRRPGRFDREIQIGVPDKKGRTEILQIHTRGMPLTDDVNIDKLAEITYGYTGADLSALTKEAAMRALRRVMPQIKKLEDEKLSSGFLEKMRVTNDDFKEAMKKVEPSAMREVLVEIPNVKWSDIGGLEDVKQKLKEMIEWPLVHEDLFKQAGVKAPRGMLLYGPPGTGKTLLAKAIANESNCNFISIKGPELLNKYVGESERGVRKIFQRARQVAPSIIFFDELDSLAGTRGMTMDSGAKEGVVAQLLAEIDGVSELKDVVIIGSTNRPDLVDKALLRPGRLEKMLYVHMPDEKSRLEILKVHTKDGKLANDVNLKEIAGKTEGYSGADLAALVREAGMTAIRERIKNKSGTVEISKNDFNDAIEVVKPSLTQKVAEEWEKQRASFKDSDTKDYIQ